MLVDVPPLQGQQFAAPHTGGNIEQDDHPVHQVQLCHQVGQLTCSQASRNSRRLALCRTCAIGFRTTQLWRIA